MGLAYVRQVWMTCNTSYKYTQPTQHHNKQKHWHYDLPRPLTSSGFNFIGECDCRMFCNQSQSTQHGDLIFIDETNIFFILLNIILRVLDRHTHELKVSYFSDYLLFYLSHCIETTCTNHIYPSIFYRCCPPSPCHVLAHAHTDTTVDKIVHCC